MARVTSSTVRKVLVSPGFGAGWSTWADTEQVNDFLFDAALIAALESGTPLGNCEDPDTPLGDFVARMQAKHGGHCSYTGGASDLRVQKITGRFYVNEYDGHESVVTPADHTWH